jgi:predicted nucleic acid-binding protein
VSAIVVDASVGLKWFVPEVHSVEARRWRSTSSDLHTLAVFFDIEIANALWKKIGRAELSPDDAAAVLRKLPSAPLQRHSEAVLVQPALDLARQIQRTVYDSLYVALAVQLGGRMVTADQRLYNRVSATPLANYVVWVADIAAPP